jgi:hypothetical protein
MFMLGLLCLSFADPNDTIYRLKARLLSSCIDAAKLVPIALRIY